MPERLRPILLAQGPRGWARGVSALRQSGTPIVPRAPRLLRGRAYTAIARLTWERSPSTSFTLALVDGGGDDVPPPDHLPARAWAARHPARRATSSCRSTNAAHSARGPQLPEDPRG